MNKTYNINLGGIPFQIDDIAFEKLNAYLQAVKRKFSAVDGKNEIVEDIEARIAEMFQDNLKASGRTIVSTKDVDGAISTMGRPEEFDQGYSEAEGNATTGSSTYRTGKKLYRDTDDKVLGGVISGVTKYFGFNDPTWFRIALILLPVFDWLGLYISTGLVIITYFVLWMVVPKAQTSTEKMQMRGEAVNLDNIERSFNEGVDNVKKNLAETNQSSFFERLGHLLGKVLKGFGKLLLLFGLVSLGFLLFGIIISFLFGALGIGIASPFLTQHIFGNGWMSWAAIVGLLLMSLAPAVFFITLFIKLLFKTKIKMPAIALGTLGALIVGLLLTATSIGTVIQDFRSEVKTSEQATVNPTTQVLSFYGNDNEEVVTKTNFVFGDADDIKIGDNVDLKFRSTIDSSANITVQKSVRGKNQTIATERLNNLVYNYNLDSTRLTLDQFFELKETKLWRDQEVDVIVTLPSTMMVSFDESMEEVLNNGIHINSDNWYYGNKLMNHRYWKLTNNEFVKVDAEGNVLEIEELEPEIGDTISNSEHVEINLFGEKLLTVDVEERNENGKAERVQMRIGNKKIIDIEVDETGERIKIDTDTE